MDVTELFTLTPKRHRMNRLAQRTQHTRVIVSPGLVGSNLYLRRAFAMYPSCPRSPMISYSTDPVISLAIEELELPELNLHSWSLTEIAALDGKDLHPVAKKRRLIEQAQVTLRKMTVSPRALSSGAVPSDTIDK